MAFGSAAYRNEMQRNVRSAARGTGWRQSRGVVFRQIDDWFVAGHWRQVSAEPGDGLRIELMAKPMALDPMLWETMGLEENNDQPLSFRYWGAFVCGTPVLAVEVIRETEPERAAPAMIATLDRMLPGLLDLLAGNSFSELAKAPVGIHDNWRMGETIIHALRLENRPDLARQHAASERSAYSNSPLIPDKQFAGKTHHELVTEQLREQPAAPAPRDNGGPGIGAVLRRFFRR